MNTFDQNPAMWLSVTVNSISPAFSISSMSSSSRFSSAGFMTTGLRPFSFSDAFSFSRLFQ